MNTKQKKCSHSEPPVYPRTENISAMVICAWELSKTSIWLRSTFPLKEELIAKKFIRQYISNQADRYEAYLEFCQRILLLHKQIMKVRGFIPGAPSRFFDPYNAAGFAVSLDLFLKVQHNRLQWPLFNHAMKAFCEALLDMREEACEEVFHYWINWFRERNALEEYSLFYSCCKKPQKFLFGKKVPGANFQSS